MQLSEIAYKLCIAIEHAGASEELTDCSVMATALRQKLCEWEEVRPMTDDENRLINAGLEKLKATQPKFNETSCSQCGAIFGPGDHGYSHCSNHKGMLALSR